MNAAGDAVDVRSPAGEALDLAGCSSVGDADGEFLEGDAIGGDEVEVVPVVTGELEIGQNDVFSSIAPLELSKEQKVFL